MADRLGPLEFTDGGWVIGDPAGDHVRLERDCLTHWVHGAEPRRIAWSRVVSIALEVQPLRRDHSRTLRRAAVVLSWLGQPTDHVGLPASVSAVVRHPYEDWQAGFTHHARRYPRREITVACELLDETTAAGEAARLGDPEWLTDVVRKLSEHRYGSRARFPRKRAVREVLAACSSRP
jgi:hypothetical protein